MPASAEPTVAARAWALFWRIFVDDKPRRMAVMGELGLSFMQAMALSRDGRAAAHERAGHLDAVRQLQRHRDRRPPEAAGLAERRPAEHDRRVKAILLTEKGEALRAEAMERMGRPPAPIAALSEKDARALRAILRRAAAHLDEPGGA